MRISERRKERERERAKKNAIVRREADTPPAPSLGSPNEQPLTAQERDIVRNFTTKGAAAFDELGWTPANVADFFGRAPVRREMERLAYMVSNGEAVLGRQAYLARLDIGDMIPACLGIVRRALRGQLPDSQGNVLPSNSLPDTGQIELAMQLLAMCGIDKTMLKSLSATDVLSVELSERTSSDDDGKFAMTQVLGRERSRDALEKLVAIMQSADAKIAAVNEKRDITKERKARRASRTGNSGVE